MKTRIDVGFDGLSEAEIDTHMRIDRYGDFRLTPAVRPNYHLTVVPQTGYRRGFYHDEESNSKIPIITAAASREVLIDLFFDLLDCLPDEVNVVLDSTYGVAHGMGECYLAEDVDLPVLKSWINDFEDVVLNDGCVGIAVFSSAGLMEVQLDEHKLIIIYANNVLPFESVLRQYGVEHKQGMKFIHEAEHVHQSSDELEARFNQLRELLGAEA